MRSFLVIAREKEEKKNEKKKTSPALLFTDSARQFLAFHQLLSAPEDKSRDEVQQRKQKKNSY